MGKARLIIMPLFISLILTCITYFLFVIIDLITNYHTADLLLNVDFVRNYQNITLIEELSYHFLTTFIIVIITIVIYVNFNKLKIIFLTTLFIIFTVLYPILIKMSERDIFQYSLNEHVIWIVGHILFLYLLNIIVTRSYLK
ncbi:hypothetical protein [Mammaliicoccus lentus]|uniref:Uncharacterized protein n=2 Tax=Mammaliicoccus lentus TaxID=42858 RepID=A0AAX3W3M1_MAMLE|nr:hypothetical protein [Mammaliicoccus lentus]HBV05050.1 hypothetical protein [Staphylococcus sp.]POA04467.1 hypothetical protein CD135_08300 [Mammaliicoccus lentus]WHI59873.1 hypothetical protein PYH69_14410 [Mammaliicoccus lentus]WQK50290.1 hypothetical protein P3U54_00905 [Mammaliicoccus lentus]SUM50729.1 Uncharacterised protein [Mammaliicoccus lentus]